MDRNRKRTPLYVGGIIILIIIFVGFFGGPFLELGQQQQSRIVFGKYRNREIAYEPGNYFALSLNNLASQPSQQLGANEQDVNRLLWREAFNQTLFHEALLYLAARADLHVSEPAIDAAIATNPQFQGIDGFDPTLWRGLTQTERLRVRNQQREALIHNRVLEDIQSGILIGENEIEFVQRMAQEERKIRFAAIGPAQIQQKELKRYVAENAARFTRIRSNRMVLSGSLNEAQTIRSLIAEDGSNFSRIAQEYSIDGGEGLSQEGGWYWLYEIESQFPTVENIGTLLNLPAGQLSEPISEDELHTVFFIQERLSVEEQNQETLFEGARTRLRNHDTETLRRYLSEIAIDFATIAQENNSLYTAAQTHNVAIESSNFFSINYGNSDLFPAISGDETGILEIAAYDEDFFRTIFTLQIGEISQPLLVSENFIVAQLIESRETDPTYYERFGTFYRSQSENWQEQDARRVLLKRDFIYDNFEETYAQIIISEEQ